MYLLYVIPVPLAICIRNNDQIYHLDRVIVPFLTLLPFAYVVTQSSAIFLHNEASASGTVCDFFGSTMKVRQTIYLRPGKANCRLLIKQTEGEIHAQMHIFMFIYLHIYFILEVPPT